MTGVRRCSRTVGGVGGFDAGHQDDVRVVAAERAAEAGAFFDVGDAEPSDAAVEQHGGDELGAVAVAVGLDDGEELRVVTGGCADRGDVVAQARR